MYVDCAATNFPTEQLFLKAKIVDFVSTIPGMCHFGLDHVSIKSLKLKPGFSCVTFVVHMTAQSGFNGTGNIPDFREARPLLFRELVTNFGVSVHSVLNFDFHVFLWLSFDFEAVFGFSGKVERLYSRKCYAKD